MPKSIKRIERSAFAACYSLEEIDLPENLRSIGDHAFETCHFNTLTLPEGLETIGRSAFYGCGGLSSITLPASLKSIGDWVFQNCFSLSEITIPSGVQTIGEGAFSGTPLTKVTSLIEEPFEIVENVFLCRDPYAAFSGNFAISFTTAPLYVPKGCKEKYMATRAWNKFYPILEVGQELCEYTDPESGVVYQYVSNENVAVVKTGSLISAGSPNTKGNINILKTLNVDGKTYQVTEIRPYAFYDCQDIESVTIPSTVVSIGEYAFYGCVNMKRIDIPASVTFIDVWAFGYCQALESVSLPKSLEKIDYGTFQGCISLKEFEIPESVTTIGSEAFRNCKSLKSITIPKSLIKFDGRFFFTGCQSLESFVVEEGNPVYDSRENCNGLIKTEDNELVWGYWRTVIPASVTRIGENAFTYCAEITSINIPQNIKSIGGSAFSGCPRVTSITLPEEQPELGGFAFSRLYLDRP